AQARVREVLREEEAEKEADKQVLATVSELNLEGLNIPSGILESGRKSFTLRNPMPEDGAKYGAIEIMFYPHNAGYRVKGVQAKTVPENVALAKDNSWSLRMRKF
ncbi:unnamed protein product, partial [Durusdinium trenchii]